MGELFWTVVLIVIVAVVVAGGTLVYQRFWGHTSSTGRSVRIDRLAARISDVTTEVATARTARTNAQATVETARTTLAAAPNDARLTEQLRLAQLALEGAEADVTIREDELAGLVRCGRGASEGVNVQSLLNYMIFGGFALYVLAKLMDGITSSPPAGTTPRSMITFLIAVVTVGIALILVLSTIVSSSEDREKRFSQGKEIFTALLGVLGTIVGFYFGTAKDTGADLPIDDPTTVVLADGKFAAEITLRGGKAPYQYAARYVNQTQPFVKGHTSDKMTIPFVNKTEGDEFEIEVSVTDADGRTGTARKTIKLTRPAKKESKAAEKGPAPAEPESKKP